MIAGSDARMPHGIMSCTALTNCDIKIFRSFENQEQVADYFKNMNKTGEIIIEKNPASISDFLVQHAFYFCTAFRKNPKGIVKSFMHSHF